MDGAGPRLPALGPEKLSLPSPLPWPPSPFPPAKGTLSPVCALENSGIGLERADLLSPAH